MVVQDQRVGGRRRPYLGFSRSTMQRLIGVHQFLTVEAALYLHG